MTTKTRRPNCLHASIDCRDWETVCDLYDSVPNRCSAKSISRMSLCMTIENSPKSVAEFVDHVETLKAKRLIKSASVKCWHSKDVEAGR